MANKENHTVTGAREAEHVDIAEVQIESPRTENDFSASDLGSTQYAPTETEFTDIGEAWSAAFSADSIGDIAIGDGDNGLVADIAPPEPSASASDHGDADSD